MTISLCMIVKNEEKNIGKCLASVAGLFDEINIVDTGSTDKTIEIVKEFTDRIFHFDWIDDFAAARNFSFSKATQEYIMWLDADDTMDTDSFNKFLEFKKSFQSCDADCICMPYIIDTDDSGKPTLITQRERIVKNSKAFKWERPIHEQLKGATKIIFIDSAVTHTKKENDGFVGRNMAILEKIINSDKCTPLDNYYYGILLNGTDQHEKAVEHLNLFINNNKDKAFTGIDAFIAIYNSYISLGDHENAYKVLALNEEVNKDKAEYYCLLGFFIMNYLEDYEKAQSIFKRALNCNGKESDMKNCIQKYEEYYYFKPWKYLGQCYIKQKDYKNARDAYVQALKYDENNEEMQNLVSKLTTVLDKI